MSKNGQVEKEVLDQYFTPQNKADEYALSVVKRFGTSRFYIEPSAGDGAFIRALIKAGVPSENIVAFDIDPKADVVCGVKIEKSDFFDVDKKRCMGRIAIGNPPYGKGGSLAIKFMNQLKKNGCNVICFLNPLCVGRKHFTLKSIDDNLHLIDSIEFPDNLHFRYPNGEDKSEKINPVRCEFQIWSYSIEKRPSKEIRRSTEMFEILSVSTQKSKHDDGRSKELEMCERSDYNELRDKIDFTIVSHGSKAGEIIDFAPDQKCTVKLFVRVMPGYDVNEVREKLVKSDLTQLTKWSTISHNPSISASEIIEYVEMLWGVKKKTNDLFEIL